MGICGENEKLPIANPDHAVHLLLRSLCLCRCILRYGERFQTAEDGSDMMRDLPAVVPLTLRRASQYMRIKSRDWHK